MSLITRFRPPPVPVTPDQATPDQANPDQTASAQGAVAGTGGGDRATGRRILAGTLTVGAALLVFVALVVPDGIGRPRAGAFVPAAFLRIPIEGLLGAAILIVLPSRARRLVAVPLGLALGVLTLQKLANIGFLNVVARRFNPVLDWPLFGDGYNALVETDGQAIANGVVVGVVLLVIGVLVVLTLAVLRLARVTARYRTPARRTVIAFVAAWLAFALVGTTLFPGAPVASDSTARTVLTLAKTVPVSLRDAKAFAAEAQVDAFADTPPSQLLAGLRGKDVVFGVVESYGRSALEDPLMAAIVEPALFAGEEQLSAAGYAAKSGFLTSSTYGGGSWLAHASFQSGLWIDNQQRYNQLVASDRLTITNAFHQGGWNTFGFEPGNTVAWPEGSFYGYDTVYDSRNLGYQGPRFGWSRMPDQYTIASFQRNAYGKPNRPPLMAELSLTSSHEPWTPVPRLIDWDAVGDGSVFGPMAKQGEKRSKLWKNATKTRAEYARSVAYSVNSLTSWAEKYGDENLVMVIFGDHQPIPLVSGQGASHDVPITIVAHDKAVLDRISGWGWQDGLKPDPQAPVWRMDEFRDRFLTAFGAQGAPVR